MVDDKLILIVEKMRKVLEMHHESMKGFELCNFPNYCCEPASVLAYLVLMEHGWKDVRVYQGSFDGGTGHYWVQADGVNIDLTYDQEAIAGKNLYGFSTDDQPYIECHLYKLLPSEIEQRIADWKLHDDIDLFRTLCR